MPLYLYLNIFTILFPLLLSFDRKVTFYKNWPYLWPAIILNAALFIIWDELFTQAGIWGFNEEYLVGIYLFNLPLEEVLFFITVPYACVFIYECLNAYITKDLLQPYAKGITNLKISAFYGGHSFSQERASLAHPPQLLVATPGRLTDHLNRRTVDLSTVKHLVLDEADKLLEMGFEEEIDQIMEALPAKRQVILFSATMPQDVKDLIEDSLKNPQFVKASANAIPARLKLVGIKTAQEQKQAALAGLLKSSPTGGTAVFCNTRAAVDDLAIALQQQGIAARALHGGMEQPDRDKMMTLFRNGTTQVLVATDVAARGLDIDLLQTIVHYELPDDVAAYQHRSGRTGRAGKFGTVYTFATPRDERKLRDWDQVRMDQWLQADELTRKQTIATAPETTAFATITINAGRKDKLSPRDIVGALIAETGLTHAQIGKIEVQDRSSFVAVPQAEAKSIAEKLSHGKIKGRRFRVHVVK